MPYSLNESEVLALQSLVQPLAKGECALIQPFYVDFRKLRRKLTKILEECEVEKKERKTAMEVTVTVGLTRELPLRKKPPKKKKGSGGAQGATGTSGAGASA